MVVRGVWGQGKGPWTMRAWLEPPPGSVRTVEAEASSPGALGRAVQTAAGVARCFGRVMELVPFPCRFMAPGAVGLHDVTCRELQGQR